MRFKQALSLVTIAFLAALSVSSLSAWGAVSITDPAVTEHVESELLGDPAVPFDSIDVDTDQGIVTLTGTVTNLEAQERATRIAGTVRGVRAVINRIEVEPLRERSAAALQELVEAALLYDPATETYQIDVGADDDGLVTLTGTVDSWQERELAEAVAKGVSGVTGIENNIAVEAKVVRPTSEIKPEIRKALHRDTLIDDAMIDIRVEGRKVYLSGIVGSAAEKQRAKWNAWVDGVREVDIDGLTVERWARDEALRQQKYAKRSDLEIREAVQDALLFDPRMRGYNIDVGSTRGIVTLRGIVDNLQARKAAQQDASTVVGVIGVKNLLKVRPVAEIEDRQIADNIRGALSRNPFTETFAIQVRVENGVAHLDGTVDSYFEKAKAENVAFRAKGVTSVRNSLDVKYPEIVIYDPYVYDWSIYDYYWYENPTRITNKSDWLIKQDIANELIWSPFVDSDKIEVSVENGIATLRGTVDSWSEYFAARENAIEGGAREVINKIEVK